MALLIAGLAVFIVLHSIGIAAPAWRSRQIARMGERRWKGVYSLLSAVALVMIVVGFGHARADAVPLYQPLAGARHAAALLNVVAFVLIASAYVSGTRIKAVLGHPMTLGVALWAIAHLIANGRLHDVILFGVLLAWSLVVFVVRRERDRHAGVARPAGTLARDAIAVVAGVIASLVFALFLHGPLIGVRPFG